MFARTIYTVLLYLLAPLLMLRLATYGLRYHRYFDRWRERFGLIPRLGGKPSLWVHAVSVGEVNAAIPLVEALLACYPDCPLLLTTVTPTGSARVKQVFGKRLVHTYLPYDLPGAVRRFLERSQPLLGVIVETELWPNLYMACAAAGIPLLIANARLSARSMRGYQIVPGRRLIRATLHEVAYVAAQSPADAARFCELGASPERVEVVGNLKFDMPPPLAALRTAMHLRDTWGKQRLVWIAASTHEPEEQPVLQAHLQILQHIPDALLLIAPRHPERFHAVEHAASLLGLRVATRSVDDCADPATQCFIIDTMGELLNFYAAADLAFVGGSLAPIGGHNVLEPAVLGCPVLVGPHTFNFADITGSLLSAGAAERLAESAELAPTVLALLQNHAQRQAMGKAAIKVSEAGRGALNRTLQKIEGLLGARCSAPAESANQATAAGR